VKQQTKNTIAGATAALGLVLLFAGALIVAAGLLLFAGLVLIGD
jgi:hypothetical protein